MRMIRLGLMIALTLQMSGLGIAGAEEELQPLIPQTSPQAEIPALKPPAQPVTESPVRVDTDAEEAEKPDPVEVVQKYNLMAGLSDGQFHPEETLTRAQLAHILVKAFKLNERMPTHAHVRPAVDVPEQYWAYDAIRKVMTRGVMEGYRDGYFYPEQRVSRVEALAIFAQAYGVQQYDDAEVEAILSDYADATEIPDWARKAMATTVSYGFLEKANPPRLEPMAPMTRGAMAYALAQYLERLHESEQKELQ